MLSEVTVLATGGDKMKKTVALLLAVLMLAGLCTAFAEEAAGETAEETAAEIDPRYAPSAIGASASAAVAAGVDPAEIVFYDHLKVGNVTAMRGDFFTDLWGNATSDLDVRALLHSYDLVRWNSEKGGYEVDPSVVSGIVVSEDEEKNRSFFLVLYDDLTYSDGSQITAWDYAFSFLLQIAPEIAEIGGTPKEMEWLLGYDAYRKGEKPYLAGVHVVSDNSLSITLDHEYLPFFFEMGLLSCNPYPISVIAPGVAVKDDGEGVYLANENGPQESIFTAELLQQTINDPATGYRSHPSVVSGPYTLTAWDGVTAEFDVNPNYKGNADGKHPLIPSLTYTLTENGTMIGALQDGTFDLLNKVMRSDVIMQGMALIGGGEVRMSNYPRSGLSMVRFVEGKEAVASQKVRQAIAWCMDRDAIVADYTGNFGQRVDGYYGIGQWMVGLVNGTTEPPVDPPEDENDATAVAEYEATLEAWDELSLENLTEYALDVEMAQQLLEEDGWTLNADGLRQKEIDGKPVVLSLTLLYPEGNTIAASLEEHFVPHLREAGIALELKPASMAEIARQRLVPEESSAELLYQAMNFPIMFDPSSEFAGEAERTETATASEDEEPQDLYGLSVAMRSTEPGEVLQYVQRWIALQERINEELPMIPLYSNVYFDFYTSLLHDYAVTSNDTWSEGILGAVKAEIPEYQVAEAEEDDSDLEFED